MKDSRLGYIYLNIVLQLVFCLFCFLHFLSAFPWWVCASCPSALKVLFFTFFICISVMGLCQLPFCVKSTAPAVTDDIWSVVTKSCHCWYTVGRYSELSLLIHGRSLLRAVTADTRSVVTQSCTPDIKHCRSVKQVCICARVRARARARTHTHTHTLSLPPPPHTHSLTHTHTLPHTHILSLSLSHIHTHVLSLSLSHTHTHTISLALSIVPDSLPASVPLLPPFSPPPRGLNNRPLSALPPPTHRYTSHP